MRYLRLAGKPGAVDIATLAPRGAGYGREAKPRLRFDKVATGLIEDLKAASGDVVPEGMTVALTITAPIRLASKTAAALKDELRALLGRRSTSREAMDTIHGNRIRVRLLRSESKGAPKLIGFVHNRDSNPLLLFDLTREWLELMSAETAGRTKGRAGDRWLVVVSARSASCLEAYRCIYSQLRGTGFKKAFMVFGDGRVESLTE
jgi:hypothetical protein